MWRSMLAPNGANNHITQLYREPEFLEEALSIWLTGSLQKGGGALILATQKHRTLIEKVLENKGLDPGELQAKNRLVMLDVDLFLDAFLETGIPDPAAFDAAIEESIQRLRAACGDKKIHAWGEAVEVLRQRNQYNEASLLEELWNEATDIHGFSLLCSYNVDNLDPRTHQGMMAELTGAHTHRFAEPDDLRLNDAVHQAIHELYGEAAASLIWAAHKKPTLPNNKTPIGQRILDHSTRNHSQEQAKRLFDETRKRYETADSGAVATATQPKR